LPLEWVNIVKNANKKNKFEIIYVNHPLTDNLVPDSSDICIVYDYKEFLEPFLKSKLSYLTEVRRLKFTEHNIKVSLDLSLEPDTKLNLLKFEQKFDMNGL